MVTDNAANVVAAVKNTNWRHLACFAHTLNLVLGDGLRIIQPELTKIKDIISYFKRSSRALVHLSNMQKQLNLPLMKLKQDCITRWNSSFDMLSRILKVRGAVVGFLAIENPEHNSLSPSDWVMLQTIANVLEIFKAITEEISAEKNVTLSKLILMVNAINKHLVKVSLEYNTDIKIRELIIQLQTSMTARFAEIDNLELVTHATFLDPRFKKYGFPDSTKYDKCVSTLKRKILSTQSVLLNIEDTQPQPSTFSAGNFHPSGQSLLWNDFDRQVENIISNPDPHAASIVEIDKYISEPLIKRTEDPLLWWDERKHIYPRLYTLMRRRLCIVATSVPCERIFSKAGMTINTKRSSLKPKKAEECLFLNFNL